MGYFEAAEKVLKKTKRPMKPKEIVEMALSQDILSSEGKTPEATMGARLYMDIIRKGSKSKFVKIDKGLFGLKSIPYKYRKEKGRPEKRATGIVKEYTELMPAGLLDEFADYFAGKPGIYALYDNDGELWYIGLANDLKTRLSQHQNDRHQKKWTKFRIFVVPERKLNAVETILIQIGRPKGNRTIGNISGAKNITDEIDKELNEKIKRYRSYQSDFR